MTMARTGGISLSYDDAAERPASEIALRLPDGEELRGPLETDWEAIDVSGLDLKTYHGCYRLGDLPKEKQGVPIFTRKPGQEQWTRETAFWDPDLLVRGDAAATVALAHHDVRVPCRPLAGWFDGDRRLAATR